MHFFAGSSIWQKGFVLFVLESNNFIVCRGVKFHEYFSSLLYSRRVSGPCYPIDELAHDNDEVLETGDHEPELRQSSPNTTSSSKF